jgi:hypothetical protein
MARRSQAGTVAIGAIEGPPPSTPWRDREGLGRRIIASTMNHDGAFGNIIGEKALRLSYPHNE